MGVKGARIRRDAQRAAVVRAPKPSVKERASKKLGVQIAKGRQVMRVKRSREAREQQKAQKREAGTAAAPQPVLTRHEASSSVADGAVRAGKKGKGTRHKDELAELAKTDPEFFEYLKKTDEALLQFKPDDEDEDEDDEEEEDDDEDGEEEDDDEDEDGDDDAEQGVDERGVDEFLEGMDVEDGSGEVDDDEEEEDEDVDEDGEEEGGDDDDDDDDDSEEDAPASGKRAAAPQKGKASAAEPTMVSAEMIQGWQRALLTSESTQHLRQVVAAFRAAVRFGDSDGGDDEVYTFPSGHVFNSLMQFCLQHMDDVRLLPSSPRRLLPLLRALSRAPPRRPSPLLRALSRAPPRRPSPHLHALSRAPLAYAPHISFVAAASPLERAS